MIKFANRQSANIFLELLKAKETRDWVSYWEELRGYRHSRIFSQYVAKNGLTSRGEYLLRQYDKTREQVEAIQGMLNRNQLEIDLP